MSDFLVKLKHFSLALQNDLFEIKIIFILFGIIFLIALLILLFKSSFLRAYFLEDWIEFISFKSYGLQKNRQFWKKIRKLAKKFSEGNRKLAVIKAGEFFEKSLEKRGFSGKTILEKLDKVDLDTLPNLKEVKKNIIIYQNVISDPSYHLKIIDTDKFLDEIEKALYFLGVI